jgi:uncharacterized protein (TIGR03000 family)
MLFLRISVVAGILVLGSTLGSLPSARGSPPSPAKPDSPVLLTFVVPSDAEVWIEGTKTTTRGPVREFVSPALKAGQDYIYTVRVHWQRNGQDVNENRSLTVRAGDTVRVNFTGQYPGYTLATMNGSGERSYYYTPDDQPAPGTSRYYVPSARDSYEALIRDRYLSYYGATLGYGSAENTGTGN